MSRVPLAFCVVIRVTDPVTKQLRNSTRPGRVFTVGGVKIKLFPIGVMAEALDRKQRTIIEWEKQKLFPTPMYAVPNSRTKRWYSEAQILACNELWLQYRGNGKSKHFPVEEFLMKIRSFFYKVDIDRAKGVE